MLVTVTLDNQLNLGIAHEICDIVEREISKTIARCNVIVHVNPGFN
ncbi:MAG: hypothetical protein IPN68_17500 [Bacteroidetes bacterium]|nr:hypothetical protein [Bacteroidota bacterium]